MGDVLNEQLINACRDGDNELVKKLIKQGADINVMTDQAWVASPVLFLACEKNHVDVVKTLIDNNVDVNKKSIGGWPVLMHIQFQCLCDREEIYIMLLNVKGIDVSGFNDGKGIGVAYFCCMNKCFPLLKLLLERRISSVNETDGDMTLLMEACNRRWVKGVELLLFFGADLSLVDSKRRKAVDFTRDQSIRSMLLPPRLVDYTSDGGGYMSEAKICPKCKLPRDKN